MGLIFLLIPLLSLLRLNHGWFLYRLSEVELQDPKQQAKQGLLLQRLLLDLALIAIYALVTSRHDYFNALYVGVPFKISQKLQFVQNVTTRLLARAS